MEARSTNIDSQRPLERASWSCLLEPIDGGPLIVSLHGYGANSADHSLYFPLHERVNEAGFGLLLPNGTPTARETAPGTPPTRVSQHRARPVPMTLPTWLVWCPEQRRSRTSGLCTSSDTPTADLWPITSPARGCPASVPLPASRAPAMSKTAACEGAPAGLLAAYPRHRADGVIRFDGDRRPGR